MEIDSTVSRAYRFEHCLIFDEVSFRFDPVVGAFIRTGKINLMIRSNFLVNSCLNSFLYITNFSMERYDTLTGVWSSCPAMNTRRRYCRLAVLDNCIYAVGGFDSTNYQASVERFDPRVGEWTPVPNMTSRRSSCGVAALDGDLYCIGGKILQNSYRR